MMTLAAFMRTREWTDQQLAAMVSRDRSTITKIRLGQTLPSLDLAVKIERATGGKVRAGSFLPKAAAAE